MKKELVLGMLIILLTFTGCSNTNEKYSKEGFALGTFISLTIYSDQKVDDEVFDGIFNELNKIEATLTINADVNSEIEQINAAAGKEAVVVSDETFYVLKTAYDYTKKTEGKFDITVGALVKLWNIGFDNAKVPTVEEINNSLQNVGINEVNLNEEAHSVKLERAGMLMDLGGIAKGYAADRIAHILMDQGYERALINLGGNVLCMGVKPDGRAFKVGIRDPKGPPTSYLGIVTVQDNSVVTSGVYERSFVEGGVTYHHILDTVTGYPVNNNLESISIITKKSIDADALSTGVFSMGLEIGFDFVSQLEGVEAIFVTKDKKVVLTEGAKEIFELTAKDYELMEQTPLKVVSQPEEEVQFEDSALEEFVRVLLKKTSSEPITRLDCSKITAIHVIGNRVVEPNEEGFVDYGINYSALEDQEYIHSYGNGVGGLSSERGEIKSLEDAPLFVNLKILELLKQNISDLTPLLGQTQLERIDLSDNFIKELEPISSNHSLKTIIFNGNEIQDIDSLEPIIDELHHVGFELNQIENADVLSKGLNLTYIMMGYNNIQVYPNLSQIKNIGNADFTGNPCD